MGRTKVLHTIVFLSDSATRAEFDAELEEGGAVSLTGRFNPLAPDSWRDRTYESDEEAADAIEEGVRAHFGAGMMDRTRLSRIVLHGAPTAIPERLLSRYAVPLMVANTGKR